MKLLGQNLKHRSSSHDGELWIVSYADMMTLLFGFFVILHSLSSIDEKKLSVLGKELAAAFRGDIEKAETRSEVGMLMEARQIRALQLLVAMLNLGDNVDAAVDNIERKVSEAKDMNTAKEALLENLKPEERGALTTLNMTTVQKEDRVDIALPDTTLFSPGTADLTPMARDGLRRIARSLTQVQGLAGIEISGHTDSTPTASSSRYPSNWALSAARAGAVAEELLRNGVRRDGLTVRGMADLDPLFPERRADGARIPENMSRNRRVQISVRKRTHVDQR